MKRETPRRYNTKWLIEQFDQGVPLKFIFFWGHTSQAGESIGKFIFSQWYFSPFIVDDIEYKTTEHWMMAHKALLFNDQRTFEKILAAKKPGEVKELGRLVQGFDETKWNTHKFEIVKIGSIHKFNQHEALRIFLLNTSSRIIVEASPVDRVWGIGRSQDESLIENPYTWNGENLLGFALMEVRDFFRDFGNFEYLKADVLPPWKKYPEVNPMDMFWRMGYGEEYLKEFMEFFERLSEQDRKTFKLSYPPMGDWIGYYGASVKKD